MADDTAQSLGTADPVAEAAALFRSIREPEARPRDDAGRYAAAQAEAVEPRAEIEAEAPEAEAEVGDEYEVEVEAAEEAQPEPTDMPSSWSKEDAEHWDALPPATQAMIARREGQRDAAVNQKFQEASNARKAADAEFAQVQANRAQYADALETLMQAVQPIKPDPRAYGAGTGNYDREAFDLAVVEYDAASQVYAQLSEQRDQQRAVFEQEDAARFAEWKQSHEAQYAPKFVADVPDLNDPVKAPALLRSVVDYALEAGIPETAFQDVNRVTSAELHILWKAQQYDRQQEAKTRVTPKAKTAAPPVRPGVATPRATQQSIALQKDLKRLGTSGTIEDGAAVFKHFR